MPDVVSDYFFVSTYGRGKVASRPKVFPHIVFRLPRKLARYVNRTFPLNITNHLRDRVLRWNDIIKCT